MKSFRIFAAVLISLSIVLAMNSVCFAQPATADTPESQKAFVTFVYGGTSSGEWVIKGTSVTPPAVPVIPGAAFCGWDAPLTNIQNNQQINAVYKPNTLGEAAIEAAKKALPSPAISATGVADPNASPILPLTPTAAVTVPATTAVPATTSTTNATPQPTAEQQQQLLALITAQQQTQQQMTAQKNVVPASASTQPATDGGNAGNFNLYNNVSQQNTTASYVLNTNTMKVHYPSCRDVPKISAENYAVSNAPLSEILSQGYTTCGHCKPH